LGIENRKPKIVNFSLSNPATTTKKKLIFFIILFFSHVRADAAPRPCGQQIASAGEGGGEGGRGEGREGEGRGGRERGGEGGRGEGRGGRECLHPRGRPLSTRKRCCVRADALCGWRFEGGREVSSSARTGLCPLECAYVRADGLSSARTRVFYPQVFHNGRYSASKSRTTQRPSSDRPSVRPSVIVGVTTLAAGCLAVPTPSSKHSS
jgi:hypothetical protein